MRKIIVLVIAAKLITFLIIFLAASLLPYSQNYYKANFVYPPHESHTLLSAFKSWDGQHYLFLIDRGYQPNQLSNAFFPLFPLTGALFNVVLHNAFLAGMLVSNIASFAGLLIFYLFLRNAFPDLDAYTVVCLFVAFPTAFYLSLPYSESLFLLLLFTFFYFLYQKKFFFAGLVSFLLPLARPMGAFVIIPFLIFYLTQAKKKYQTLTLPSFSKPVTITADFRILFAGFIVLGVLAYFLFMQLTTGNLFSGFIEQDRFVLGLGLQNLLAPLMIVQNFFTSHLSVHAYQTSAIDRALFVFFLLTLPLMYKKLDKTMFSYAVIMGITPFLGTFMAFPRYMLPIFPVSMALAAFLQQEKYRYLLAPYLMLSFGLQIFFTVLYALNYWTF